MLLVHLTTLRRPRVFGSKSSFLPVNLVLHSPIPTAQYHTLSPTLIHTRPIAYWCQMPIDERTNSMPKYRKQIEFDPESESLIEVIVSAVAAIQNREHTELPPMGETIDLECLDRLIKPKFGEPFESGHVTFEYAGMTVTLDLEDGLWVEWD